MPNYAQRSFAAGEITPALYARTDQDRFALGLKTARNGTVMRSGGFQNRPGTRLVAKTKTTGNKVRLIPFVFSLDQAYILEFGDKYIRFYKNESVINIGVAPTSPYEVVTPYSTDDLGDIQFAQRADVMTLVHPLYPIQELKRFGDTNWTLSAFVTKSAVGAPTGFHFSNRTYLIQPTPGSPPLSYPDPSGQNPAWYVEAYDASGNRSQAAGPIYADYSFPEGYQNSDPSITFTGSPPFPKVDWNYYLQSVQLSWTAPAGSPVGYYVYRMAAVDVNGNAIVGRVATVFSPTVTFTNNAGNAQIFDQSSPPKTSATLNPFAGVGNYPSETCYYQDRLLFGGPINNPETVWASVTGSYHDFDVSIPVILPSDSLNFTITSDMVNPIRRLHSAQRLVAITETGEFIVGGDASGALSPGNINVAQHGREGGSNLRCLTLGQSILFVQAFKSIIRDMTFEASPFLSVNGYRGNDITYWSSHLFDGYTILDWDCQKTPDPTVWVVRSDGALLSCTFIREQLMIAWTRHDTDGLFENICAIPEGSEMALYFVVKRGTERYIERMANRLSDDLFMDSAVVWDGSHVVDAKRISLDMGGVDWNIGSIIDMYADGGSFSATDVGNYFKLTGSDGKTCVVKATHYTSASLMNVEIITEVPVSLRSTTNPFWTYIWENQFRELTGLTHLNSKKVSVYADEQVIANPNNAAYKTVYTVSGGTITLPTFYTIIAVGLPYISDIETLDIDTNQGQSMMDKTKNFTRVTLRVMDTRGGFVGNKPPTDDTVDPLQNLTEIKMRDQDNYNPQEKKTGTVIVETTGGWDYNARVFIRQVDPLPMKILAIVPGGYFQER